MADKKTVADLLEDEIKDLYSAEKCWFSVKWSAPLASIARASAGRVARPNWLGKEES